MTAQQWFIYALVSPNSGEVRYVGYTVRPAARLRRHLADARSKKYPVHKWLAGLLAKGRQPVMRVLESGEDRAAWPAAERKWIAHFAGPRLLNVAPGGYEPYISPEARERGRQKLKQRVFTPQHRARIAAAKTGVPRTDAEAVRERLRAVSEANRGKKMNLSEEERERRRQDAKENGPKRIALMWATMSDAERARRSAMAREQMRRVWAERKQAACAS